MSIRKATRHRSLLLLLCSFVFLFNCNKGLEKTEELAKPTQAQAEAYGSSLATALNECNMPALKMFIDIKSMASEAVRRSKVAKKDQRAVLAGVLSQIDTNLLQQTCPKGEEAFARFLRVRERSGRTTVLLRTSSDEGLNYLEFYVGQRKSGALVADDLYAFLSGSTMIETLQSIFDALVDEDNSEVIRFKNIAEKLNSEPAAGIAETHSLPASLRESKSMQGAIVQAASNLSEKEYKDAIAEYQRLFPDDPSVDLVSIDGLFLSEKYEEALAAIDRLDKSVGGDEFLNQIRSGILIAQGIDFKLAATKAKAAIAAEPTLETNYLMWFAAELGAKNYSEAAAAMTILTDKYDYLYTEDLLPEITENHEEFAKSDAWAAYKAKSLGKAQPEAETKAPQ